MLPQVGMSKIPGEMSVRPDGMKNIPDGIYEFPECLRLINHHFVPKESSRRYLQLPACLFINYQRSDQIQNSIFKKFRLQIPDDYRICPEFTNHSQIVKRFFHISDFRNMQIPGEISFEKCAGTDTVNNSRRFPV